MPARALRQPEALFAATTGSAAELVAATADEIAGWRADGIGVHAVSDDSYPAQLRGIKMRNAVMSGYAAATLVVEAGETSGARIQARLALGHGRPVILTSHVMRSRWAQAFATRPGVHVVRSTAELIEAVNGILNRLPAETGVEGATTPQARTMWQRWK
ncbi:DNA-processing protein DprA [Solwaraspora sp. WMMA2101]|uniref:DNA-processing protein DprA n=1 Tax=Solwaraspora sp. WMMA2101 TaxID=3404124 RepID=UPI003B94668F